MEKNNSHDNDTKMEKELPFGTKENMVMILNSLFRHGRRDLLSDIISGMSKEEYDSKMDSAFKLLETAVEDRPSIVEWLHSGLFKENEYNVPLALLFIALYEHPSPNQENVECDFR